MSAPTPAATSVAGRLEVGLVCHATTPAAVAGLESLPVDSLWVGGHVASTNPTPEAIVQLARLSAVSERVRIGTSVLLLPLYPPAIVAKQLADIDRASGGRLTVGVGVGGEYPQEFRACGVPLEERGARTDEAIGLLRRLWTAEEVDHAGAHFEMRGVRIHPAPRAAGLPAIVVAGRRRAAMRRAALVGDGWMPYLYSARRYRESVAAIRSIAGDAGRDLATFEWIAFVFANVHDDPRTARAEAAAFLGGNYRQRFDDMVDRVALAGTVDEVAGGVADFVDAGARHLVFLPASRERGPEIAERLAFEVMDRVRRERPAAPGSEPRVDAIP